MRNNSNRGDWEALAQHLGQLNELREKVRYLATRVDHDIAITLRLIDMNLARIEKRLRTLAAQVLENGDL
jgi:hypothetical protein